MDLVGLCSSRMVLAETAALDLGDSDLAETAGLALVDSDLAETAGLVLVDSDLAETEADMVSLGN